MIVTVLLLSRRGEAELRREIEMGMVSLDFRIQSREEPRAREADDHPPRTGVLILTDSKNSAALHVPLAVAVRTEGSLSTAPFNLEMSRCV